MMPPVHRARQPKMVTALLRVLGAIGLVALLVAAAPHSPVDHAVDVSKAVAERAAAAHVISRDTVRGDQWQLNLLHAEKAWKISTGAGVTVAVIDSGVAGSHPDLEGQVLPGIDFVEPGGDGTADAVGHGTTVAALIAGKSADGNGAAGLAPDAKILPIRVLNAKNEYDDASVIAEAVIWAVDHGAKVINMSLGGSATSSVLADAIDYAFAQDVVVVACVGNVLADGPISTWYPAREPGVLAVTALNPRGELWKGSLSGPATVLAAPGTDLVGARPGGYQRVQGTSFASPLVAATAALIRSKWPQMSAANVVQRLITTARDEGIPGRDDQYGFGVLDPQAALTASVPVVAANPLDTAPPPGRAGFGTSIVEDLVPAAPSAVAATVLTVSSDRKMGVAAALAGLAVLVGSGLTLLRKLLPPE